jgi:hypothetical protein
MVETKLSSHHPASMAARVANRLRPSNDHATADEGVCVGTGPTRTHTTIHKSGNQQQHGAGRKGEVGTQALARPSAQMAKKGYER